MRQLIPDHQKKRTEKRDGAPLIEEIDAAAPVVTPNSSEKKSKKTRVWENPTPAATEAEEEATDRREGVFIIFW